MTGGSSGEAVQVGDVTPSAKTLSRGNGEAHLQDLLGHGHTQVTREEALLLKRYSVTTPPLKLIEETLIQKLSSMTMRGTSQQIRC